MNQRCLFLLFLCLAALDVTQAWVSSSIPAIQRHTSRLASTVLSASANNNNNRKTAKTSNQKNQQKLLDFINQPMETTVGDADVNHQVTDSDLIELVECIAKAADGRKAEDIVALNIHHVSTMCSYLVILSGNSRPQNQAIAAAILEDVKEAYDMTPGGSGVPEGSAESGWILLDYGSVMVHIMTPKSRLFYNVEGQWKDKGGKYMDLSHILVPNKMESENALSGNGYVPEEEDPFWS